MYFEFEAREQRGATWAPVVDVCERQSEIVIFVEVPGVARDAIQLSWNDGILIISGQKSQEIPQRNVARFLCVERAYGQFRREIAINIAIDHKQARADLKNGLMTIHLPKAASQPEPSDIPIL